MDRAETLALFAKGKDAWNRWAHDLARERDAFAVLRRNAAKERRVARCLPDAIRDNSAAEDWFEKATANFSNNHHRQSFRRRIFQVGNFPGPCIPRSDFFLRCAVYKTAQFADNARFNQATFMAMQISAVR